MSAEDDLGRMISEIVPEGTADLATMLSAGQRLGTLFAGVYRGLIQGGVPQPVAADTLRVALTTVLSNRK